MVYEFSLACFQSHFICLLLLRHNCDFISLLIYLSTAWLMNVAWCHLFFPSVFVTSLLCVLSSTVICFKVARCMRVRFASGGPVYLTPNGCRGWTLDKRVASVIALRPLTHNLTRTADARHLVAITVNDPDVLLLSRRSAYPLRYRGSRVSGPCCWCETGLWRAPSVWRRANDF